MALQVVYTVRDGNLLNIEAITFTCQKCEIINLEKKSVRRAEKYQLHNGSSQLVSERA